MQRWPVQEVTRGMMVVPIPADFSSPCSREKPRMFDKIATSRIRSCLAGYSKRVMPSQTIRVRNNSSHDYSTVGG